MHGASGLTLVLAVGGKPALALDECGPGAPGGTVTCTPAGNTFPNGIEYKVNDLTVVVQDGVIINTTGGAEPGGVVSGGGNYGNLTVKVGTASGAGVTITTDGNQAEGISVQTDGTAAITSFADITTGPGDSAEAIFAVSDSGAVTVESTGNLTTIGDGGDGIWTSVGSGAGDIVITSVGDISTKGLDAVGIYAEADQGDVKITSTGDISTVTSESYGILGRSDGGTVTIVSTGDIEADGSTGVWAETTAGSGAVSVTSKGDITVGGVESDGIFAHAAGGAVTVNSTGDIVTTGNKADGIDAYSNSTAKITITSVGNISTGPGDSAQGIRAVSTGGDIAMTSTGDIATIGDGGTGLQAVTSGAGAVAITSTGDITTTGLDARGIVGSTISGAVTINSTGNISTEASEAYGIWASTNTGAINITSAGDIATGAFGIFVESNSAASAAITSTGDITTENGVGDGIRVKLAGGVISITSTGDIATAGNKSDGIYAFTADASTVAIVSKGDISTGPGDASEGINASSTGGNVSVSSTGNIATTGDGGDGLVAATSGTGTVSVTSIGDIATSGLDGRGIHARSDQGKITILSNGDISTLKGDAYGIWAQSGSGLIQITATGSITTLTRGIWADTNDGNVHVYAQNARIATTGNGADGILAVSAAGTPQFIVFAGDVSATGGNARGVAIDNDGESFLAVRGNVSGGWGNNAAGIDIEGNDDSQVQITDGVTVGALNDVAIRNYNDALKISNLGTITGHFSLLAGDDVLRNFSANSVNLRDFADTDGDGVRDTESVAIADFGAQNDTFDNVGTLRLAGVSGATTIDTTGQVAHPAGGNSDITQDGVEQGHIVGLETFYNSGLITMSDGAAGDLLVITEAPTGAGGGAGQFVSRGGTLSLDFVADDGSSKQSDILVLDNAVTDTGPTRVLVTALGSGAQTTGDGIQIIHVSGTSDADAFTDGGGAVAGAYQYELHFQNLAKSDQNWYLRSSFFEGALEYPSISTGALMTWYSDLDGLHERLGQRRAQVEDGQLAALNTATDMADAGTVRRNDDGGDGGWFRVTGSDLDVEQTGASDFDLSTVRAQGGFDLGFNDVVGSDDWLVVGALAGYGWSAADFDSGAGVDFDVATIGAYATYFRGPYYLDALIKFDWLDGDYDSSAVSDDGDVELPVFGLSLETGYRFDLTQNGFYLEPQAQLAYAHAGDDSITDDSGSVIKLQDADSLRGRLGARLGQELGTTAGAAAEPVKGNFYLEAAVAQEFLGETDARVSGLTLEQELPETTFELGGGFDIALPKDGITFTLDADYILGDDVDGVSATGGFRINW